MNSNNNSKSNRSTARNRLQQLTSRSSTKNKGNRTALSPINNNNNKPPLRAIHTVHQSNNDSGQNICVAVRVRPLAKTEKISGSLEADSTESTIKNKTNEHTFEFDSVFGPNSTQEQVYEGTCGDMIDSLFKGFNRTILAYGQTGSGKVRGA